MGLVALRHMEILLDQGWNLCLLHWQVDSYTLHHQGSPIMPFANDLNESYFFTRLACDTVLGMGDTREGGRLT